jgi:hypothetical protein
MPMPTPPKSAAARSKPARGAKATTRSAVADIRRTTHDTLDAFPVARKAEARSLHDGLKKGAMERKQSVKVMMEGFRKTREKATRQNDAERRKTVDRMMDGFSQVREETARETVAKLQHNMQVLHRSVIEAKRDVDVQMKKIADKRKAFAPAQARMLAKTHDVAAKAQAKIMHGLTEAREAATDAVQSDLKRFAKGMRAETAVFRNSMRAEIGNGHDAPAKGEAGPARKASAANGARRSAASKPAMAAKTKAKPAAKAKSAAKPARSAMAKVTAAKSAPAKFKARPSKT